MRPIAVPDCRTPGESPVSAPKEDEHAVDAAEFDELYRASSRRLVGQIYAMTGDMTEAQDVVQEAFARAWERRDQLDEVTNKEAWIRTVAGRLAISRWRKAKNAATAWMRRQQESLMVEEVGPDHVALVNALRQIPDVQRQVIVLHHLCDLSVEDIARETLTPSGTVKARLVRGRAALARLLDDSYHPEEARRA